MNKNQVVSLSAALLLITLGARTADAAPITWTLQNVTFASGATGSGSFAYDATSNAYSSLNLSVSAFPVSIFQYPYFFTASNSTTLEKLDSNAADLTGAHVVALAFVSPLTNAGGTIALVTNNGSGADFYTTCANSSCGAALAKTLITGGSVTTMPTTAATPEPTSLSLIPLGLLTLALAKRRCGMVASR